MAYQRNNQRFGSIGYVAKNVQLMVLDMESKKAIGSNKAGTIWYKFICTCCSPQTCELQNCYNYKAKENTIGKDEYSIYCQYNFSNMQYTGLQML